MNITTRFAVVAFAVVLTNGVALAEEHAGHGPTLAAFGNGLNTAGAANHKITPTRITVKVGELVDFSVAGFHFIRVYKPGTTDAQVRAHLTSVLGCPIPFAPSATCPFQVPVVDPTSVYYTGFNPTTFALNQPVLGSPPFPAAPPGTSARAEEVVFTAPGRYLVICSITPHFLDGMFAYVDVKPADSDDD